MDEKQAEKTPMVVSKSFMAVGPTLHYSHENVQRCWLLAITAFCATCLLWSQLTAGSLWSFNIQTITSIQSWHLGRFTTTGISIFEYPWQILVLGFLMGIMAIVPILISQLMSFTYSIPFILAIVFLANLPGFALCLLVSCIAVACRPLRFRSRFIAISLCTAPQLFYWVYFGSARAVEPLKFGFSLTPWICAWLAAIVIAGFILGIGHFTRYRPGLVWMFTTVVLAAAVIVFQTTISFDELDYQLYIARNNPEKVGKFHDHSITEALDATLTSPDVKKYLAGFFYPSEPIPLRAELKKEIQTQLAHDRWPSWFIVPEELNYQAKKYWLSKQYDLFINRRPKSRRMPIALYYKALLGEYTPDIQLLGQKELLHFASDYPQEKSREIWYRLYREFSDSPESIEARWRIAKHWAGQDKFKLADNILIEAQTKLEKQLKLLEEKQSQSNAIFSPFQKPVDSAITTLKLCELQIKLSRLRSIISEENQTGESADDKYLAKFIILNPYSLEFETQLNYLSNQIDNNSPLRDNIQLAQTKLIADEQLRAEKLKQLHEKFPNTDGGQQALYELTLLKINFWQNQSEENPKQKAAALAEAKTTLEKFIRLYPESIFANPLREKLGELPGN